MFKPLALVAATATVAFALTSLQADPVDTMQIKKMVEEMGYKTEMLAQTRGQEKFQFPVKKSGYEVPVAVSMDNEKTVATFSVLLGPAPAADKHTDLLKVVDRIQPSYFYISREGDIMLAISVDNRGIDSRVVKHVIDKLSTDVVDTAKLWQ